MVPEPSRSGPLGPPARNSQPPVMPAGAGPLSRIRRYGAVGACVTQSRRGGAFLQAWKASPPTAPRLFHSSRSPSGSRATRS